MSRSMRRPAVAGSFYPLNSKSLTEMLKKYTERRKEDSVVACVSPHAGYVYSGKTAGKVHSLLPDAETFVIIGPNHTGYGLPVAVSVDEWLTPLGKVEVDLEFVDAMPKKIVAVDELAHKYEHSLEVQLPFLQHLHED
ncbi:MAG: AmmeMemoRadiSam system protein B, partial [Archaeoglobaceae archaeon]